MNVDKIIEDGQLVAVIVRGDWDDGINFVTPDNEFMQLGFWGYDKGHKSSKHRHVDRPRNVPYTQEVLFIKTGRVKFSFYHDKTDAEPFRSVIICAGEVIALLNRGTKGKYHQAEVLDDGTRYMEIKAGPFDIDDKDVVDEDMTEPECL